MDFFKKIFGTLSGLPPHKVGESFVKHFIGTKSVEWTKHEKTFEAIFFEDDIEKTAQFDQDGKLLEYTANVFPDSIPAVILSSLSDDYEIMNCIAVYTAGPLKYELIVRNKELNRFLVWVDPLGQINKWEKL